MSGEPWSDERLHDAYGALVSRPTPPGLEEDVMAELREHPARPTPRWWRPAALLPAAAALTSVIVVAVALFSGSAAPISSPAASSSGASPSGAMASASPAASPSPGESLAAVFPDEALGLPVITVSRLVELTDGGGHAGEVFAVGGWYTPEPSIVCPATPHTVLELDVCEAMSWLRDRSIDSGSGGAINPKFVEGTIGVPGERGVRPIPVVFLGHIGDERASLCPAEKSETCERQFVVDRVAWADGAAVPLALYHEPGLAGLVKPSLADAESYVEATLPGATVLSAAYLAGETVRRIEPLSGYQGDGALYVVRVIGPRPCGPLLGDGTYGWSDPLLFTLAGEPVPHPQGPCVVKPL